MAEKHGSFIFRYLKSENAEEDAQYAEEEPKYGVEEVEETKEEGPGDEAVEVEVEADVTGDAVEVTEAEAVEVEVETVEDEDADGVDAKLKEQMAALQHDLEKAQVEEVTEDVEMEEVQDEEDQLMRLPEPTLVARLKRAGGELPRWRTSKEELVKLVKQQLDYNSRSNKRPPLPGKPPLPPTPPPKWIATPPEAQEAPSATKRQRVLDLRKGPFPKWNNLDEGMPPGAVREITVVPPRDDKEIFGPAVVPPRENGAGSSRPPVPPKVAPKAMPPPTPKPPNTPPPGVAIPKPPAPPAQVPAGLGKGKAFDPPGRWAPAPEFRSNIGETLQKHLEKAKQEELRKHAAKKTTEAAWWNAHGHAHAQAANAANAAKAPAVSGTPNRPVAGFSNAWEAVTLRLSAVDPSIEEADKKARKAFEEELQLEDEGVTLGLSFLNKEKLHQVLSHKENFLWKWNNRAQLVRQRIAEVDPSADALVREVMTQEEHTGKAVPKTPPKASGIKVVQPPAQGLHSPKMNSVFGTPPVQKPRPPNEPPPKVHSEAWAKLFSAAEPKNVFVPPPKPVVLAPKPLLPTQPLLPTPPPPVAAPQPPARPPPKQQPAPKPQHPQPPATPPKAQPPAAAPAKPVAPKPRPHQPKRIDPKAQTTHQTSHQTHPPKSFQGGPAPPLGPPPQKPQPPKEPPKPVPKTPVPKDAATNPASGKGSAREVPARPAVPAVAQQVAKREKSRSRSRERPVVQTETKATPAAATSGPSGEDSLDKWLRSLDGEGVMMKYSEALHREFSNINELSLAIVDPTAKGLKVVEPSLWESLGIQTLGHKLFFSQGLKNLQQ